MFAEFFEDADPVAFIVYVALFAAGFAAVQAVMGLAGRVQEKSAMNQRLKLHREGDSVEAVIGLLRKRRALNAEGEFALPVRWFNQLVTRSGLAFQPVRWAALSALVAGLAGGFAWYKTTSVLLGAGLAAALFIGAPIFVLSTLGSRRAAALSAQMPDALGVVVRSLEAGHPVPSAIALVGREMPDPVGSEFGLVGDEMAYGASMGDAVSRFALRSSDPDVDLFVATVRLQEQTGGNLAELLKVNADAIRERQMLRLKVKASSSEGRASAMILTSAPFIVAGVIHLTKPEFYGDVMHIRSVQYAFAGFAVWMFIGNMIMRRMIAFRV